MSNVISFNVYKNTLRRSSGNDPVSSESGYTEILCRFKEGDDWEGVNGGIVTAGFFVNEETVYSAGANLNTIDSNSLEARFKIPGQLVGNRNPIYFGITGSYSVGNNNYETIATNVVKLDVIRGVVVDNLQPAVPGENPYQQMIAVLNDGLTSKLPKLGTGNVDEIITSKANGEVKRSGVKLSDKADAATVASLLVRVGAVEAKNAEQDTTIGGKAGKVGSGSSAEIITATGSGDIQRSGKSFANSIGEGSTTMIPTTKAVKDALDTKANAETVQTLLSNVTSILAKNEEQDAAIAGKAAANHTHSEYVTDSEMQEALENIDVDFDASKAVRAFNGENDEIIKYLSKEPQTDAAYANSNVNTQITERWDIPGSLAIDVPTNTACFRIVDCKSGNEWKEEASGASFVLKNLIPGRNYRYYALKADDTVLGAGCCTARGQVRMIDVPKSDGTRNVFNIRDIGGWACDGGRIKYGLIFRGSRLNGANSNVTDSTITLDNSQIAYFKNILNIKYEIDLRSTSEAAEQEGSVLGDDVGYMRQYIKYYQQSIQDNGAQYKVLIEQVADNLNAGKVTYIHCASGADRTSQLCFFIEAICGVSLVNIENDYELTYYAFEYKSGIIDRRRNKITNACWKLFIDELNNETGSTIQEKAVNYLLGKGVTTATIGIIREKLIEHCVPTRTSQLENDSGFLTQHQDISGKEDKTNKVGSLTQGITGRDTTVLYPNVKAIIDYVSGELDGYALLDQIPENTSDLNNDSGYIPIESESELSGCTDEGIIYKVGSAYYFNIIDGDTWAQWKISSGGISFRTALKYAESWGAFSEFVFIEDSFFKASAINNENKTSTRYYTSVKAVVDYITAQGFLTSADVFSPTATVTQTASGATVTITDKNGTTTANISNGADGQDYVLTAQDKSDIADIVLSELPTTQGVLYGNTSN